MFFGNTLLLLSSACFLWKDITFIIKCLFLWKYFYYQMLVFASYANSKSKTYVFSSVQYYKCHIIAQLSENVSYLFSFKTGFSAF